MELDVRAISCQAAILEDIHDALGDAIELHSGLDAAKPAERILPAQEDVSNHVAQVIRLEPNHIGVVIRWRPSTSTERHVDRLLRHTGRVLPAVAEIRVANKRAGVTQSAVDVSSHCQLVIPEQVAEHERRSACEHAAVARRVADRRISDVVGVERDVVRVLLEPRRIRKPVHWVGHQNANRRRQVGNQLLRRQHR